MMEEYRKKREEWKKYSGKALLIFFIVAAGILFSFALTNLGRIVAFGKEMLNVLQAVLIGIVIAYLLNPIANFIEQKGITLADKKKWKKLSNNQIRMISVAITEMLAIMVVFTLASIVLPQLLNSLSVFMRSLPGYVKQMIDLLEKISSDDDSQWVAFLESLLNDGSQKILDWINSAGILKNLESVLSYFATSVIGIAKILLNIIIGVIISIYLLVSKQKFVGQGKKVLYAVFNSRLANNILDVARKSHMIFSGFISGKIIDSLIIGVICFIGMTVMKMPYIPLVSVLIGVTNVIPFFGPYLGAIPSILLILLVSPGKGIMFLIFIVVLQQVDGNVIGPKILGSSTGLSAFWVIFAILIGSGLFGIMGMITGVPVFAVIYYLLKTWIEYLLKKRQLPVESKQYEQVDHIEETDRTMVYQKTLPKEKKRLHKE
ncbi:MAG: AI-2E family transporter [Lachnospiraceae bacterium]|nr:AI-2E family transporter [Robinsoniella sp.]MDY3767614.1 AI-2E family transporter [Lachnospiraceae bacterium]